MITRKALIEKLKGMNLDTVLYEGYKRSYRNDGSRFVPTSYVLQDLLDVPVIGQFGYCGKRGKRAQNPKWLVQLFTEITWSVGAIHVGDILQHLAA